MRFAGPVTALSLLAAGCASTEAAREANDPFEPANRAVFEFNMALDRTIVEPTANAYVAMTPAPIRAGVRNVMTNLNRPVVFANAVLQGDASAAGDTLASFAVDTVFGLGGVFAIARAKGVPQHEEDFGQTLAVWGLPEGPYVMLPLLGPSSVRDATGRIADRYPHPFNYNDEFSSCEAAWALRGLNGTDLRARAQTAMDTLDRTAIDPYAQLRSAWRQSREAQIRDSADRTYEDLPDFD